LTRGEANIEYRKIIGKGRFKRSYQDVEGQRSRVVRGLV